MGATSVTGVGQGSAEASCKGAPGRQTLGVGHLIGPHVLTQAQLHYLAVQKHLEFRHFQAMQLIMLYLLQTTPPHRQLKQFLQLLAIFGLLPSQVQVQMSFSTQLSVLATEFKK